MTATPVDFITAWLAQEPKMEYPPKWGGGWERWAQGQIAQFVENSDGYQVWTEQHIYKNKPKSAIDLEFRRPAGRNGVRKFVELKCFGAMNDDSAEQFIERMLKEYVKIQLPLTTGSASEPSAKGSTLWVIGIAQRQFRDWIREAGDGSMEWGNFNIVSVDNGGVSSGTRTFDVYYWAYQNNN